MVANRQQLEVHDDLRSAHKLPKCIPHNGNGWTWKLICDVVVEGPAYISRQ